MLKFIPWFGFAASAAVAASALSADTQNAKMLALIGGATGAGSSVCALLAIEATSKKYKGISDIQAEIRRQTSLLNKDLDNKRRLFKEEEKLIRQKIETAKESFQTFEEKNVEIQNSYKNKVAQDEQLDAQVAGKRRTLQELTETIIVENDLSDAGFGARRYIGLDSASLTQKLKECRERQKALSKELLERCLVTSWTVDGSAAKGKRHVKQTLTALLRGFNAECDAAISTLKHSNDSTVLGKIERSFKFYLTKAEQQRIPWSDELLDLKEDEAHIVHDNELAKHAEREEQAELRRMKREEEKAQREAEEAREEAEREAEKYAELLRKAKEEAYSESEEAEHLAKINELQRRLEEAESNRERAISRAQLTRSGHVYVISNIGSFGHNVFKVGMTRRLDPTERVRELGDASVPFPFDIHAMIFTEDAPGLENAIHKRIDSRRLNLVNTRREFFTITMDELEEAAELAARDIGVTAEVRWSRYAIAEQYRQSVSERDVGLGELRSFGADDATFAVNQESEEREPVSA